MLQKIPNCIQLEWGFDCSFNKTTVKFGFSKKATKNYSYFQLWFDVTKTVEILVIVNANKLKNQNWVEDTVVSHSYATPS